MDRMYLSQEDFTRYCRWIRTQDDFYFLGHSTVTVPSLKLKYINREVCREWPDLEGNMVYLTPGEAARTELDREFKGLIKRNFCRPGDLPLLDKTPPLYCPKQFKGSELVYIDLVGAYYQIYRYLSIDMSWPRGQGSLSLMDVGRRLSDWKPARNAVVGLARSRHIFCGKGDKTWEQSYKNMYLNPALWYCIQDILHQIAWVAVKRRALYVGTDCYIFDISKDKNWASYVSFRRYLEDHRLAWRTIPGSGEIKGIGNYRVGKKETLPYSTNHTASFRPINYIDWSKDDNLKWLNTIKGGYHYEL